MGLLQDKAISDKTTNAMDNVIKFIGNKNLNPSNILDVILYTMSIVEKLTLPGSDKKQMCLTIIYDIINNHSNIANKEFVISIVDNIFDSFVENIIDVTKNNKTYGLNKKKFCIFL